MSDGKVIDLNTVRAAKQGQSTTKTSKSSRAAVRSIITNQDVLKNVYDDIIDDWQAAAVRNKLSDFIRNKLPAHVHGAASADYVNDLNTIAHVETKLNMKIAIFSPEVTPGNSHGWLVGFHRGTEVFSGPSEMVTESYARAFNLLLFVGLEAQLKKLKR